MNTAVVAKNLEKSFRVASSQPGSFSKFKQFVRPRYEKLNAVNDISFEIKRGEKVAFIGPNGAGKSTTIKLLVGIFQPSGGSVQIFNKDPFIDRKQVACKIGTVFGQRSHLWYHLSALNSFTLIAAIYEIEKKLYKERLEKLVDIFQLSSFISRPVKELSLGERMRCELVGSLLHNPEILFLDEPTIGLDIISKDAIRRLIRERAELDGMAIFLTSHDVDDIEKVCDRIIMINQGKIVVDDSVKLIKQRYFKHKLITLKSDKMFDWIPHPAIKRIERVESLHKFEIDLAFMSAQEAVFHFAQKTQFSDIVIEDPPLEEIIKGIYQS